MTRSWRFCGEKGCARRPEPGLDPSEAACGVYAAGLILLILAAREAIPGWPLYALGHSALLGILLLLRRAPALVRDFFPVVFIPAFFFLALPLVPRVNPVDADGALLAVDRRLGGLLLLRGMKSLEASWLTTAMKLAWISYYVLPLIPLVALHASRRRGEFLESRYMFVLTWLSTFALYFLVPARGPGYGGAEIGIGQPQWTGFTARLKHVIHALEGPARDTFPSGHAAIAAVAAVVCVRHRLGRLGAGVIALAAGVVASTLYLRYHYVVDVAAGLLLAGASAAVAVKAFPR